MTLYPILILGATFILGMPVAFSMIASCVPYFLFNSTANATILIQKLMAGIQSASLMAIPFFIVAGAIMNYSGITERLMKLADSLGGHLTGGLGHVNILLSTMMGGISGSGAADAAMECKLLVPEMEKHGYDRDYSAAVTAAISPAAPPPITITVGCVFLGGLFICG